MVLRSSGENSLTDNVLSREFGISRELIKKLPVNSLPDVAAKAKILQEYLNLKAVQAELLLKHGHTANLLLNELADLQMLQAQREMEIVAFGKSPLDDKNFMANKDRIISVLLQLQKLGVDNQRLDMEREKLDMEKSGVAFTVASQRVDEEKHG